MSSSHTHLMLTRSGTLSRTSTTQTSNTVVAISGLTADGLDQGGGLPPSRLHPTLQDQNSRSSFQRRSCVAPCDLWARTQIWFGIKSQFTLPTPNTEEEALKYQRHVFSSTARAAGRFEQNANVSVPSKTRNNNNTLHLYFTNRLKLTTNKELIKKTDKEFHFWLIIQTQKLFFFLMSVLCTLNAFNYGLLLPIEYIYYF